MKRETAEKAAKWWADRLRYGCAFDNGDNSNTGAMAMMLALMVSDSLEKERTPEQVDLFELELANKIEQMDAFESRMGIGVDYHPDQILSDAGKVAGIKVDGALPWKTGMRIDGDTITVKEGYGAQSVILK